MAASAAGHLGPRQCGRLVALRGLRMLQLPRRPPCLAPSAPASVRGIRTGFFAENENHDPDPEFIDPSGPLLAPRVGSRWRYMDDPSLSATVLERSNVGMGMLVLNRPQGLDLSTINELYVRLRNLEVNSLKRFVGLTAMEEMRPKTARDVAPFCPGLDTQELLLAAVVGNQKGELPNFSRALLWHHQELAHLVGDYRKPLVCQMSGPASNGGAALACLANFSGACSDSEVRFDSVFAGLTPLGGVSFVLAGIAPPIARFLVLTGWPLKGADIVLCGLAKYWMSHEALPFLELTAEKHLEVTERDSRELLREHALPVPSGTLLNKFGNVINTAFRPQSVKSIVDALMNVEQGRDQTQDAIKFAQECRKRLKRASPLAAAATLALIDRARGDQAAASTSAQQDREGQNRVLRRDDGPVLLQALKRELCAAHHLLIEQDAVQGLRARLRGVEAGKWKLQSCVEVMGEDVDAILPPIDGNFKSTGDTAPRSMRTDFAVLERSDISLSTHPRLRRYHPDWDPATGLDHDPAWMEGEVRRWSPDLFKHERGEAIRGLLGEADPALHGQARYIRGTE